MQQSSIRTWTNGTRILFCAAVGLATAPVWRLSVYGVNPTLDELLQLSLCGGPIQ